MANTSRGFTPRKAVETPSYRKFMFKKPGSCPLASEISGDTPFLSTDNVNGHTSTENPYNKSIFASGSFDSAIGEAETVFARPGPSSGQVTGHVTSRSEESEGVARNSNKVTSKTPKEGWPGPSTGHVTSRLEESEGVGRNINKVTSKTPQNRWPGPSSGHMTSRSEESEDVALNSNKVTSKTPQYVKSLQRPRGLGPHGFPNFDKETPYLFATAKQNGGTSSGISSRNGNQTGNVSSAYFSKSATSSLPRTKTKGKRQSQRTPVSSSLTTGTVSAMSEADSSVAMETETEGEISGEDLGQIRTVERLESSMSIDSQIYMGVMWHSGRLSVAYYDIDLTVIYMMLDAVESEEFKLLNRVIKQVNPTQVILSSKQDERLVKTLKSYGVSLSSEDSDQGPFQLQFLPSIDFALEICKRRVLSLELPSIPTHYTDTERTLYFNSLIPFENACMVQAVGGLLKYLEKMRVGIELEEAGVRVPVLGLKVFTLDDQMILDETAYSALQIFQRESHPSAYKAGTSNSGKEGLSLFGIMNKTKSQIGSRMLRTWFQRPLKNVDVLKQRQDAISFFVNPRHIEVVKTLEDSVKNVKNISKILTRMIHSQATVGDWQALYKTVFNASNIKEVCRVQPQSIEIFRKITETFSDELQSVESLITKIVDIPESIRNGRFAVQPHVDQELDDKKRLYSGLPDMMTRVANQQLERLEVVTECSILYLPQIGYMLAIPEAAVKVPITAEDNYHIEGLEFLFSANNILYYKSACTLEMNALFGDIKNDITDIETRIMYKLQNTVLQHTSVLIAVLDYTAELDCLLSLAACAREYDYVRPALTLDNTIEVTGGRHAIQEMCCGTFVPNDILSNGDYGKIKVLTGPNACGKSVYLKQVAVIIFLAQVGSFVPAESATLGLVDRIFTRVRSLESVSTGLSTFMIDINQMAEALRSATEQSLCIIDEFGKGTDMIDGLSLLCACLSHWVSQEYCPHIFVSTHFHSIMHQHLLPKSPSIKYLTLETLNNGEELVFLYQLTEGHTSSSFACHIAAQVGLPQEVVQRGIQVSELIRQCKPVHRADSAGIDTQFKRCSTIVNRFLELDLETADVKSFFDDLVLPTVDKEQ